METIKTKNKILTPEHFFFILTVNHGNEDCRGTGNMYQIKCNLPLESMKTTQNSKSKHL